jgi:hypothetical protein
VLIGIALLCSFAVGTSLLNRPAGVRRLWPGLPLRASVGSTEVSSDRRARSLGRPDSAERRERDSVLPIAGFNPCLRQATSPDLSRAWPGRLLVLCRITGTMSPAGSGRTAPGSMIGRSTLLEGTSARGINLLPSDRPTRPIGCSVLRFSRTDARLCRSKRSENGDFSTDPMTVQIPSPRGW